MNKRPTILVVDDMPDNIEVVGEILSSAYDIQIAFSGEEALALVAEQKPDLILLDVMMPAMDGYEVLIHLKTEETTKDIPVIFITAKNDVENETAALQAGAVDFIHKPVNADVLRARVGLFISQRVREQRLQELNLRLREEITQRNLSEAQLRLAFTVINSTSEAVMVADKNNEIISVNPAFCQTSGFSPQEAIGAKSDILRSHHHDDDFYETIALSLSQTGHWHGEVWNRRKSGEVFPAWQSTNSVPAQDGHPPFLVSVFRDISEQHEADERIRYLAFHDALTGLPNRCLFQDRLEQALQRSKRHQTKLAVLFMDLDGFKQVNDTYGHDVGDDLLIVVANRINNLVRRGSDTVARLGGDEFVILVEEVQLTEQVDQLAAKLITEIAKPIEIKGNQMQVGVSIGISFAPSDSEEATELLKEADTAMYAAKASGKGCSKRFFTESLKP